MKRYILLFISSVCALAGADELKLVAAVKVTELPGHFSDGTHQNLKAFGFHVTAYVENVESRNIVIPTTTYNGSPSMIGKSPFGIISLAYIVDSEMLDGEVSFPSQFRYLPVTIKPKERVALPSYDESFLEPVKDDTLRFSFVVDKAIARRYGWWFGSIEAVVPVKVPAAKKP
jgi:hypothetical protein